MESVFAYFFILVINEVSTSFRGLSLIGRVAFFTGVGSGSGLFLFFAFNSLRAFNDGKTRVKPEELGPGRLDKGSTSLILSLLLAHEYVSVVNHSRERTKLYIR
jgi:hypothetical protein